MNGAADSAVLTIPAGLCSELLGLLHDKQLALDTNPTSTNNTSWLRLLHQIRQKRDAFDAKHQFNQVSLVERVYKCLWSIINAHRILSPIFLGNSSTRLPPDSMDTPHSLLLALKGISYTQAVSAPGNSTQIIGNRLTVASRVCSDMVVVFRDKLFTQAAAQAVGEAAWKSVERKLANRRKSAYIKRQQDQVEQLERVMRDLRTIREAYKSGWKWSWAGV